MVIDGGVMNRMGVDPQGNFCDILAAVCRVMETLLVA